MSEYQSIEEITYFLIKTWGFDVGVRMALAWSKRGVFEWVDNKCDYVSVELDRRILAIKQRSEQLYFEFCCSDGICCPFCGGVWNKKDKKKYVGYIYWCQRCGFEWPRTKSKLFKNFRP